jgi:hypothetical protein
MKSIHKSSDMRLPILSVATPERLRAVLARGPASANELSAALQIGVPTLHRLLSRLGDVTVTAGEARRARYALVRSSRGGLASLPLPPQRAVWLAACAAATAFWRTAASDHRIGNDLRTVCADSADELLRRPDRL